MQRIRARAGGSGGSWRRSLRHDEAGASLVEFTVIATLLFTLLFGIIEFGFAFRDRLTIA